MEKKRLLCVCFGNTCRSPLMVPVLQKELGDGWLVESAGVIDAVQSTCATPESVQVAQERGYDISRHQPRTVKSISDEIHLFDLYVVTDVDVGTRLAESFWVQRSHIVVLNADAGGILNPWRQGIEDYRACMTQVEAGAKALAERLK